MSEQHKPKLPEPETITEARTAAEKRERYRKFSRVPFEEAGDGVFIHFSWDGIGKLEGLTEGKKQPGETWFGTVERLLLSGDVAALRQCLDVSLKVEGPEGKPIPAVDVDLDDPGFAIGDAVRPILNALAYVTYHKTYEEMIAEATAAREAAVEEARKAWQEQKAAS